MRRSTLRILLAALLAGLFAAPVDAATNGAAGQETVTGVLEALSVDDLHAGRAAEHFDLRTDHGVVRLAFPGRGPRTLSGATVTVRGTRTGGVLRVATSTPGPELRVVRRRTAAETGAGVALDGGGGIAASAISADAAVAKTFAVVLINFTDLATQPWTKAAVQTALTGSATSMKAFFEEESRGRMTVSASVYGWYTVNAATTGCDWRTWHTLGWNAATADGVNLSAFTNVMFIWPYTTQCGFAGVGYVPGKYTYLNGTTSVQVMTHEVGHNFGLAHANALDCTVGGARVTIAADASCTSDEYADPFSTMGNNALRHNHGSQLGELGWLGGSEKVVGAPGNDYTIAPYFGSGPVKLVRIPRGDGSFFDLDVRTPYGSFDTFAAGSPAVSGVTVRIGYGNASPTASPQATELLDATPATTDLKDAPLLVGKSITDPVSTISLTTLAVDAAGATVRVREAIDPGAPSSLAATVGAGPTVGLTWGAAADNVAVAGYRVSRDGSLVASLPATAGAWSDATVAHGSTYDYAVAAVDTSGNVGPAASASVDVPDVDPTPPPPPPPPPPGPDAGAPTAPDPLTGTPTVTTVSLAWGPATDDVGVTGYRITRNGNVVTTVGGAATAWKDTARAPRTTYAYTVAALDAAGNLSAPTGVDVTTMADTSRPGAPRHFHVRHRAGRHVTFAWSAASDNVGVVRYKVYRAGHARPVAVTTSLHVRIAVRGHVRYYVRAFDAAGNRSAGSRHVRGR